jgi:hypothetical protein
MALVKSCHSRRSTVDADFAAAGGYFKHPLAQRPNRPYFVSNGDVDAS